MTSNNVLILLLFLFFITLAESEKKKNVDKIIIHVPYKIHKHHHTHTKYKVITIPAPKHENTIIYLKENKQEINPKVNPQKSHFAPPHQQSAANLLQHLQNYNSKAEEPEEYQATTDQKFLESSNQNLIPNYEYQPMIVTTHENVLPQFLLKPILLPQQILTPKFVINPTFHHLHNFIPNSDYQTIFQHHPQPFIPKLTVKQKPPSKVLQDNVAHSNSHKYKTVMTVKPKTESYKVRENVQEEESQFHKHHYKIPTKIQVPSNGKRKTYLHSDQNYNTRSITKVVSSDPNYEYEHVGYLIIDGKSKKIVGKNFKDEIHLIK